ALLILDQQIRDAAAATDRGKRALALAIGQDEAEGKRLEATLAPSPTRRGAPPRGWPGGGEGLAPQGPGPPRGWGQTATAQAAAGGAEGARLRSSGASATRRFSDLERGRRIAQAAEAVRRLRAGPAGGLESASLADAEATLRRLRARQAEEAATDAALQALDP